MKKITKKLKGKKVLSFVLAAIMLATTFNIALPQLKLDIEAADIDIGGVKQTRVVSDYANKYAQYAIDFLNGSGEATDIVIPGLNAANKSGDTTTLDYNDFVIQGLSYYPKKDWIIVSTYHNDGKLPSMLFALSAATGDFAAVFEIWDDESGTENKEHGGGLAFSEYNFYYSGDDSDKEDGDGNGNADQIAYAPLSYFDDPQDRDGDKFYEVILKGAVDLPEMNGAATAYVCYDEGILWAGNFYEDSTGAGNYNVAAMPANSDLGVVLYNSMIYGYELQGSSSDEEWAYLTGNKGNTSDCAGYPSHSIALHTDIEDVQYAIVDKGRLYLSRSWGTGKNDETIGSVIGSIGNTPDYSTLTVADIDLSNPGDRTIYYSTSSGTRTTTAHYIDEYENYDMMPMSEGLCFIEDNLYISFEGASNKYMNEYAWSLSALTNTGNCDYPIDVIWKIDPYELFDQQRPSEEASSYYEKVPTLDNIESGEEYIIVYESKHKDPVTQKNILYAIDAFGGYKGYNLPKRDDSNTNGYAGAIGHPITEYSIEYVGETDAQGNTITRDRLYLGNPEKDDVNNIRWTLTKLDDVENEPNADYYEIASTEFYYANNKRLFCDADTICMASDNVVNSNKMRIYNNYVNNKGFWICNDAQQFLWCNDGTYNDIINQWYASHVSAAAVYSGLTEQAGTFHTNALQGENIIGSPISAEGGYYDGTFYIYKRVKNSYASTEESSIHTDMSAELQADGTYTVQLETFAVAPNHYKVGESRPTDYIFMLDTSVSMATADVLDYVAKSGSLTLEMLAGGDASKAPTSTNGLFDSQSNILHGYDYCYYDYYYKQGDLYRPIRVAIKTSSMYAVISGKPTSIQQYYWAYFVGEDGLVYIIKEDGTVSSEGVSKETFRSYVDGNNESTTCSAGSDKINNTDRITTSLYNGTYYHLTYTSTSRLDYMKTAANTLADKIYEDSQSTGLDHRIAVTRFGESTGLYSNSDGAFNAYSALTTDIYKNNAFFSMAQINDGIKPAIANCSTASGSGNSDHAFSIANNIIANSGHDYLDTGDRSVVIIMLSSGVPGDGSSSDSATSVANSAISSAGEVKYARGATVYTVKIGHGEVSGFSSALYMGGLSSKHPRATSITNLGDENPNNKRYSTSLKSVADNRMTYLLDQIFTDALKSSRTGLAFLSRDAIISEELSDAFIIPSDVVYDVRYVPGSYDKIGRISFGSPNPADFTRELAPYTTPNTDQIALSITGENSQKLEAWGYDYTNQFISPSHPGNKLRITLTGILANPETRITNTTINNPVNTALYKNSDKSIFKYFPTEYFNIPKYTYVLDYGLHMLDTDVNGTLKAVSAGLTKQDVDNYIRESENGLVKIADNDLDLLYHTTPTNATDSGYVLIQRDDGTYDWFEIEIVPASNVYFEEEDMNVKAADVDNNNKLAWTDAGEDTNTYRPLAEEGDVVGFDNAYDVANATYSNGNALTVKVNSTNRNSKTQTFDFVGTGVDIVSRCSSDTGILLVNIKNSAGKSIAASLVDTYCEAGTFNQTPVFNWSIDKAKGETYGTYTVEVSALYLSNAGALNPKSINKSSLIDTGLEMNVSTSFDENVLQAMLDEAGVEDVSAEDVELVWFDDNSIFNGGTGVAPTKKGTRNTTAVTELVNYIDGFRVYNPLGTDPSVYTEENVSYANVIDNLAPVSSSDGSAINELFGIAYITGLGSDVTSISFEEYKQSGPKGELYLNPDKAISFKINRAENEKVMLGLRAVNGTEATNISINDGTGDPMSVDIKSATEMYYDITECIDGTGEVVITITNNHSTNILAINHIKFSGGTGTNGTVINPRSMARSADATEATTNKFLPITQEDLVAIEKSMSGEPIPAVVKNGVVIPIVEEEEEIPDDNTTPDDNNTSDDTNNDNGDGNDIFDIFSLLKALIAFIKEILFNSVGNGSLL